MHATMHGPWSCSPAEPVLAPLFSPGMFSGMFPALAPLLAAAVASTASAAPAAPVHLRVEGLLEAVAVISEPNPRFSFLHGDQPKAAFGLTQASYRITVADTDAAAGGAALWDSGEVKSSNCSQIVYAGKVLTPFTRYTWTVEWTSSAGTTSAPATSRFETGPVAVADWQGAGWLSGAHSQFRNEFSLPAGKKVAFARAYVAAAGCAHIEVNGKVPAPDLRGICPWPVNTASVRYVTHDITPLVSAGKNALGMVAGNVMEAPKAIILVAIKFQGETAPTFALSSSTDGWMATDSCESALCSPLVLDFDRSHNPLVRTVSCDCRRDDGDRVGQLHRLDQAGEGLEHDRIQSRGGLGRGQGEPTWQGGPGVCARAGHAAVNRAGGGQAHLSAQDAGW